MLPEACTGWMEGLWHILQSEASSLGERGLFRTCRCPAKESVLKMFQILVVRAFTASQLCSCFVRSMNCDCNSFRGKSGTGRIVVDNGFTKIMSGYWTTAGTPRYVSNCSAWLVLRERFRRPQWGFNPTPQYQGGA